jgi:glycosyltransferase involved in cell wall biosynthesis
MKIIVISSHTLSLFWFRIDMMKEFIKKGYIVTAIGSDSENIWKDEFENHGIKYRYINVDRTSKNIFKDIKTFFALYNLIKEEKPDKIFMYQAKTVVYGSLAAKLNKVKGIYPLIAGLGSVFGGTGIKNKILKKIMKTGYSFACKYSKKVFFQNEDDKKEFIDSGLISNEKCIIINGSGVNLEIFKPETLPEKPSFLFIGRLIKDKGLIEYLEACKKIKKKFPYVRCLLVGPYDINDSAITKDELKPYINNNIIEYFGFQRDVKPYISQCSTFVLPSYHEGTPKTILEAMAMGRSIITTNAPGCKETVMDGLNGYLVEVKDIFGLVNKMENLILNPDINKKMGELSLKIAREKYDVNKVNQKIMQEMEVV